MNRKTSTLTLLVLTIALVLIPNVYAEYPIENIKIVQDLPENMVAGSSYEMIITFDNIAKDPITPIVKITVTSEIPGAPIIGYNEIFIDKINLNGIDLTYEQDTPGVFTTEEGTVAANSHNELSIIIKTAINLMPGAYTFDVNLMGEEIEPKPGPKHVTGRPNTEPIAKAGPNQKAWVGYTVYFNGSKSKDPDGTIESYQWDFGDGTTDSGVAVEHEYSESGQYNVTLTVRDNRWSYDSDTCKVKVSDPPATVSADFVERVPGKKKGHIVYAFEEANTTVTLNTTDQVTVTVLRYEENPYPGDPIPAMALPNYVDVEVSDPDAVVWPIYVEIFYTDEEVEGLDEASLGIYYWMNGAWQRCSDTGVDTERNVVWAYMTAEEASGSPILIAGMHAIPTPPVPPFLDNLTVTPSEIELGDNVTISVDIMNIDSQTYAVDIHIENVNDPPPTWPPMDVYLRIWVDLGANESKTVSHTLTMDTVGDFNVTVSGMTGSFTVRAPPLPAKFGVSDLTIKPDEVEEGEAVTVSVDVTNVGETEGSYTLELVLDGVVVGSEDITSLGGGMTVTVVFELTRGEGSYTVEFDGLTGSFTVKALPEPEFEVSYLTITPEEIELGEEVTVSFIITNKDSRSFVFVPFVQIGETMIMEGVELEGHESRTVSHTITPESVGEYDVTVDGLEGIFKVTEPPSGISPGYVAGIIIVIVAAATILYFGWKGKIPSLYPEVDDEIK